MSKVFQCDVCEKIGKPDEYGLPPTRWTQSQVQAEDGRTLFIDTCSPTCAVAFYKEGRGKTRGRR